MTNDMKPEICWSCRGPVEKNALFCSTCDVIQPPNPKEDFFELFGLSKTFLLDRDQLESHYQEMQKRLHPDRFTFKTSRERRLSLTHVSRLNEAWQTLRNPVNRGRYLLRLAGYSEKNTDADPDFLMKMMALREALTETDAVSNLRHEVETMVRSETEHLSRHITDAAWSDAARALNRLSYCQRFLEEVDRLEESMPISNSSNFLQ